MSTTGTRSANRAATSSTPCSVAPASSARVPAAWITGPSASGSENGTPSSSTSAPASAHAAPIATVDSRSGKPPIRYGISAARPGAAANAAAIRSRPVSVTEAKLREHLGEVLVPAAGEAHQVERVGADGVVEGPGDRVRGLERGDDPLELADAAQRGQGLVVGHRDVAGAPAVAQVGVLGAGAGVVEAGRDRVGLENLAVLVLHDRRVGAVEDAAAAADGQRGAVAAGLDPLPRGLDADQLHVGVPHEGHERADGVRAPADAGDHAVGKPPGGLEDLGARLVADHALEVAHQRRERRWADARADHVVRAADVGHPVADRGRHRLLQRAGARVDRRHRRPQQAHALHVRPLAPHVLGAHADDALEPEQRARRRRRHAVLAGAGLGDDPRLAHALGQQRLAERVVDLVRAGVEQVLALEVDRVSGGLREPLGVVERGRAAGEVSEEGGELGAEPLVGARLDPGGLKFGQGRHQRLGDVLAAVGAEAVLDRGGAHDGTAEPCAAAMKASTLTGSLMPGADSTPEATSTAHGRAAATASATLPGSRPPERIIGTLECRWASRRQSHVRPVPPYAAPAAASSRWKSVWYRAAARMSAPEPIRRALITRAPVRSATAVQNAGPSSPWSWTCVKPIASLAWTTSSSVGFTNT